MAEPKKTRRRESFADHLERLLAILVSLLAVATFFHGSYSLALWLVAFVAVLGAWLRWRISTPSIVSAFIVLIAAVCIQHYVVTPRSRPFSVSIETALVSRTRDDSAIVAEFGGHFISPIPVMLFMRIVNRQATPSAISVLKVQIRFGDKVRGLSHRWMDLSLMPTRYPLFYIDRQSRMWSRLNLPDPKLRVALTTPLAPYETIRGWALFDAPMGFKRAQRPLVYRITIEDTAGHSVHTIISGIRTPDFAGDILRNHELDLGPKIPLPPGLILRHFMYAF